MRRRNWKAVDWLGSCLQDPREIKDQAVDGAKMIASTRRLTGLDGEGEEREQSYVESSGLDD